ncbi:MAG: hypothetical protein J7M24_08130 [Candidatus Latescibacteria bacterium]|nr:hypothetical protein [Candidatus Latescibacterota bacterium]
MKRAAARRRAKIPPVMLILAIIAAGALHAGRADAQRRIVKVLVCTPHVENRVYKPIADVMAGSIVREFNRAGGMEMIGIAMHDRYLSENKLGLVMDRDQARAIGRALHADIVVFGLIEKKYNDFIYSIMFYEVERDIIQRTLNGGFQVSSSAMEIGRKMREESAKLLRYVPLPSELENISSSIVPQTVDPERLPTSVEISDLPPPEDFGHVEQIFSYYRVFPGETEFKKLENQELMMRFRFRDEMDRQMTAVMTKFQIYGDFAIRHGLQAFMVKDCSTMAINVLLANGIPVFFPDGIIIGYEGMTGNGTSVYRTIDGQFIETFDMTHRKRMAVLFMVPKPGRRKGIGKAFLEHAVGYYKDEWGKTPTLVEITDSMLDITAGSGLE